MTLREKFSRWWEEQEFDLIVLETLSTLGFVAAIFAFIAIGVNSLAGCMQ